METVNPVPYFPWQLLRPVPEYRDRYVREFYLGWDLPQYEESRTFSGWIARTQDKLRRLSRFYFGAALAFPLLLAIAVGGLRPVFLGRLRFLALCFGIGLAGLLLEVQYAPHYAAPLTGILLALSVQAIRFLYVFGRRNRSRFLLAARAVPVICVISLCLIGTQRARGYDFVDDWPNSWYSAVPGNTRRDDVRKRLEQQPGQHLVLVRYPRTHSVHDEWVYNLSDIDGSKIVWAHDLGQPRNQDLVDYFHSRHIWLLETGHNPASVTPLFGLPSAADV